MKSKSNARFFKKKNSSSFLRACEYINVALWNILEGKTTSLQNRCIHLQPINEKNEAHLSYTRGYLSQAIHSITYSSCSRYQHTCKNIAGC